MDIILITKNR